MLERDFQRLVLGQLATLPKSFFYKAQATSFRGVPDIVGCLNGLFVAIELKTNSKLSKIQEYTLKQINYAGGVAIEAHPASWEVIFKALEKFARSKPHVVSDEYYVRRKEDACVRLQDAKKRWLPASARQTSKLR